MVSAEKKTIQPAQKKLTFWDLTFIASGLTIGAGVVTIVGQAIGVTGPSAWLSYLMAIIWGFCICLPYLFIGSAIVVKGGLYSVVEQLLSKRLSGIFGVALLLNAINLALFSSATGAYINSLFPGVNIKLIALITLTLFYAINMLGIDIFVKVQRALTVILIAALFAFGLYGLFNIRQPEVFAFTSPTFFKGGWDGFLGGATLLLFSTVAYQQVVNFGGNAIDSKRDIPRAMLATVGIITVLYLLVAITAAGVLPIEEVANKPLTLVAKSMFSFPVAVAFVCMGPIMALVTTLNGNFANFSRPLLQTAADGWLPASFAKTNKRGAPVVLFTLIFIVALVPILFDLNVNDITRNFVLITNISSFFIFLCAWNIPRRAPDAWKNSKLNKIPKPVYYAIMVISGLLLAYSTYIQVRNLNISVVIVTVVIYAVIIGLTQFRYQKGLVKFGDDSKN